MESLCPTIVMKKNFTFSLDPEVVKKARVHAGLVPLSRFVEHLLRREVQNPR